MSTTLRLTCLVSMLLAAVPVIAGDAQSAKQAVVESIDAHRPELVDLADQIWAFAETALRETRSAAVLADYAEAHGFEVERGVAGMPTAFVATFGEGRPIIGILGEYDALPGISQRAQPTPEPLEPGAAGHGCGHNLFGAASLGAALAIKEQIAGGELNGTVRFYGTPAEEAIHKMTAGAASSHGIHDRGRIEPGAYADLVLFDPETVSDRSTTEKPHARSAGIEKVWVNGHLAYQDGSGSGQRYGRVLRRQPIS